MAEKKLTPREFYYKRVNEDEEPHMAPYFADHGRCVYCGRPPNELFMTPYECHRCAISRIGEDKYNDYMLKKEASEQKHTPEFIKKRFKV